MYQVVLAYGVKKSSFSSSGSSGLAESRLGFDCRSASAVPNNKRVPGMGQVLERAKGIEPSYAAWEAAVLPLNYARKSST